MDEQVRWVTKAEAARELDVSHSPPLTGRSRGGRQAPSQKPFVCIFSNSSPDPISDGATTPLAADWRA